MRKLTRIDIENEIQIKEMIYLSDIKGKQSMKNIKERIEELRKMDIKN